MGRSRCRGLWLLAIPLSSLAQEAALPDYELEAAACVEAHSGAEAQDCLKQCFLASRQALTREKQAILARLQELRNQDELGHTHYALAAAALRKAGAGHQAYAAAHCDFAVGASGAVASGSALVRWRCLIELNQQRLKLLQSRRQPTTP